jgi:hypothetical protein
VGVEVFVDRSEKFLWRDAEAFGFAVDPTSLRGVKVVVL